MPGKKAMYLYAVNNVRPAYSKDGYFSEAGAKTTLKALASFNPAVKPQEINLAETYTNEFVKKAPAKYGKKKKRGMLAAIPALAREDITVPVLSQSGGGATGLPAT